MNITIIGSGNVGATLAHRLNGLGHQVTLGVRDPKAQGLEDLKRVEDLRIDTVSGAIATHPDLVFVAVPFTAIDAVVAQLGALEAGTIVVDVTNPLSRDLKSLTVGTTDSAGEQLQAKLPTARVVKAFNTVGFNVMANPIIADQPSVLPVVANDAAARAKVMALAQELGFAPLDLGELSRARLTEPFALLWITHSLGHGRNFAFSYLKESV